MRSVFMALERGGLAAALLIVLLGPVPPAVQAGGSRPIVAVFEIQAQRVGLEKDLIRSLTEYLGAAVSEGGVYRIVPPGNIRRALMEKTKESYKKCYDQKCQIELGRELAANKSLSTAILRFNKTCVVTCHMYDLKTQTSDVSAKAKGGCEEAGLMESIDKVASEIRTWGSGGSTSKEKKRVTAVEVKLRGGGGVEWVHSQPAGIDFTKTEVTVAQYRSCVEAGKCIRPLTKDDSNYCNWGHPNRDNHPINCVDWYQAKAFCEWAGGRLPTEDEWYAEASNRGNWAYPWGDDDASCKYAVMDDGGDGCGKDRTWPVCWKPRGNSVSGLCDMSGNVWEWTSSLYRPGSSGRVLRGGSWSLDVLGYLRASSRLWHDRASGSSYYGFRCGRSSR